MVFRRRSLLSLAIGTRLTFAPLVLAFAGISLFLPAQIDIRTRIRNALILAAGGVIGASPILWLFALCAHLFSIISHGTVRSASCIKAYSGMPLCRANSSHRNERAAEPG
jgi:hypothetical protein